jgi:hypothetical protein
MSNSKRILYGTSFSCHMNILRSSHHALTGNVRVMLAGDMVKNSNEGALKNFKGDEVSQLCVTDTKEFLNLLRKPNPFFTLSRGCSPSLVD